MKRSVIRRKKNNSGSTIVMVLIMTSFVLILATLITTTAMINLKMRMLARASTKSFYTAQEAVDEIYAALGKVTTDCFNGAYEEQLSNITSSSRTTTASSTYSSLTDIDNDEANKELRKNFTKRLLSELQIVTTDDTSINDYLINRSLKANIVEFTEELNAYIEDYSDSITDEKDILEVVSIATLDMKVNNVLETDGGTGLDTYTVVFTDCIVKYLDENGNYSYITFDGYVGLPDTYVNFKDEQLVGTLCWADFALIGNTGVELTDGSTVTVNGSTYAGRGKGLNVTKSTLNFNSKYLVCGGIFSVLGYNGKSNPKSANVNINSGQLWTGDIYLGDKATIAAAAGTQVNVSDDLTIGGRMGTSSVSYNGDNSTVTIAGTYNGYGYEKNTSASHYDSSAIIINGEESKIMFTSTLTKLIVAGRAYITFGIYDYPLATGETVSINTNQEIYLIQPSLIKKGKNPQTKGNTFSTQITAANFFAFDLLTINEKTKDFYIVRNVFDEDSNGNKLENKGKSYYYYNFKDPKSLAKYAWLIIDATETEFEQYITTTDYYKSLTSDTLKANYVSKSKTMRGNIAKSIGTYAGISGSEILDNVTDKCEVTIYSENTTYNFQTNYADRSNRFSAFTKILAPLDDTGDRQFSSALEVTSDINTTYGTSISSIDDFADYDVYYNIINPEGFAEVTEGRSFVQDISGMTLIAYDTNSVPLIVDSSGTTGGSNVTKATCGVIVCSGDVTVRTSFDGVIFAKGTITLENGVTINKNKKYDRDYIKNIIETASGTTMYNGNGVAVSYKDIFRFWNPYIGSSDSNYIELSEMTYKDMVTFNQWRAYEAQYEEESSSGATESDSTSASGS